MNNDKKPRVGIACQGVGSQTAFTAGGFKALFEHDVQDYVNHVFAAVEFDGTAYRDGLFSDNPPVDERIQARFVGVENIAEEIWVIKIPKCSAEDPDKGSRPAAPKHLT